MATAALPHNLYRPPTHHHHHTLFHLSILPITPTPSFPRFQYSPQLPSLLSPLAALSTQLSSVESEPFYSEGESNEEEWEEESESEAVVEPDGRRDSLVPSSVPPPKLTVKEKKELVSYAHSLGKKLKSQQVGKSGVTPSVAASFVENLESNELLKIKVHGNCPTEFADAVKQLEEATGSVAIGQIGRSVILYRPSISKMKKKEEQAARAKKVWKPKPRSPLTYSSRMQKGQITRSSNYRRSSS